ncbi:MAG: hypothetical protein RIB46_01220 [Pseudomonadales bacterium]
MSANTETARRAGSSTPGCSPGFTTNLRSGAYGFAGEVTPATEDTLRRATDEFRREHAHRYSRKQIIASMSRRNAAVRAAGHAIVGRAMGFGPRKVRISKAPEEPRCWLGETSYGAPWRMELSEASDPTLWLARASTVIAGRRAEDAAGCSIASSCADEIVYGQFLCVGAAGAVLHGRVRMNGRLHDVELDPDRVWALVTNVTDAFLRRHESSWRRLVDVLERERSVRGRRLDSILKDVEIDGKQALRYGLVALARHYLAAGANRAPTAGREVH